MRRVLVVKQNSLIIIEKLNMEPDLLNSLRLGSLTITVSDESRQRFITSQQGTHGFCCCLPCPIDAHPNPSCPIHPTNVKQVQCCPLLTLYRYLSTRLTVTHFIPTYLHTQVGTLLPLVAASKDPVFAWLGCGWVPCRFPFTYPSRHILVLFLFTSTEPVNSVIITSSLIITIKPLSTINNVNQYTTA